MFDDFISIYISPPKEIQIFAGVSAGSSLITFQPSLLHATFGLHLFNFSAPIIPIILRPIWGEQPADIRAAMSLIALFGLGSIILLATLRVFWNNNSK